MSSSKIKSISLTLVLLIFTFLGGYLVGQDKPEEEIIEHPLANKVIVNFGDSIFGNTRDKTSVSYQLSEVSGAKVYNLGFGGCRMAKRGSEHPTDIAWSAYSMYALAESINSGDFSYQEENLDYGTVSTNTIPKYFKDSVSTLESIDFNTVDIITIAYGTNDYTDGTILEGEPNDVNTYTGSFEYSVNKIHEKYPNIEIVAIAPLWRYFEDGTDGCTKNYKGTGTLPEYVEALKTKANEINVPCIDSYHELSLKAVVDFYPDDGTHINDKARKKFAKYIYDELVLIDK